MGRTLLIAFSLLPLLSASSEAQSFNCGRARSADEITICSDRQLSAMDERLAAVFYQLRARADGLRRASLQRSELDWLSSRMRCGENVQCIAWHYSRRTEQLDRLLQQMPQN
jgi:uncharacterized protein